MAVKPIPEGVSPITPYLSVKNAAEAIEFYKQVFEATEVMRLRMPDGRIGHAEIRIGGGLIMLADEYPEMGILSPKSLGKSRSPVMIHLYVENIDVVYKRALEAGGHPQQVDDGRFARQQPEVVGESQAVNDSGL